MNKNQFRVLLDNTHKNLVNMTATKGEEYSRNDSDQLDNFKRQAAELGISPMMVLTVYLNKHLDAIKSFIKNGREFSEPIEGRIDDAILYLVLLKGLISDHRNELIRTNEQMPFVGIRPTVPPGPEPNSTPKQIDSTRPQFELR